MKFIISSLSPGMVEYGDFMLSFHEVTDTEFQALCYDGYSCVSHQDIADAINVAHNKEPVKARIGDIILFADMNKGVLEYSCIRICPPVTPLIREDEYLIEEEMI